MRAARRGPRRTPAEYALVVESVLEGYLLHYGRPRLLDTADEDLRLLAGDYLYALGLSRLARLGDLEAVRALADLITLCARPCRRRRRRGDRRPARRACGLLSALAVGGGPVAGSTSGRSRLAREGGAGAADAARGGRAAGRRSWASSLKRSTP